MIDHITKPISYLYYQKVKLFEKSLKYSLQLPDNPNLINAQMIFDMTPVWKKHRINAKGINYFTIGSVVDGISTRYDFNSPYYQSWLGGYIVQIEEQRSWTAKDHYSLGEADQKNWLEMYGVKKPFVKTDFETIKPAEKIEISRYTGTLEQGNIWSNTDVGGNKNLWLSIQLSVMANIMNGSNDKLDLKHNNFLPDLNKNRLDPFQKIYLMGYIAILTLDEKTKAVLYVNSAKYSDKDENNHDNFNKTKTELLDLIKSIKIVKK